MQKVKSNKNEDQIFENSNSILSESTLGEEKQDRSK